MRTGVSCRTIPNMDHIQWLKQTANGDGTRAVGRNANVPSRTLDFQISKGRISAENIIAIALAYGAHPITALIDCDYLPAKYALKADPVAALRDVSEDDLAIEVLRRMKLTGDHTVLMMPVDELVDLLPHDPQRGWRGLGSASSQDSTVSRDEDGDEGQEFGR